MMICPITQGRKWLELQNDLHEKSFFEKNDDFQYLAIEKHTPLGNYLFLPYGPVAKDEQGFLKALSSLEALGSASHAIFLRIEPQNPDFVRLLPGNSRKVRDVEPAETWVLDLPKNTSDHPLEDPKLKEILPSRLVRYYKARDKQGITIEKSHDPADVHYLVELQSQMAKEKGITTFTEEYLRTELKQDFATLYLLSQRVTDVGGLPRSSQARSAERTSWAGKHPAGPVANKVIAAGLVFDDGKTRYNLQGAQSDLGRRLHATGILTIELILDAVKNGQKHFDFWGIAPEGAPANHPWAGFTAFKKTFNGREVKYAGTYDLPLNPFKYHLYRFLRRLKP